MTATDHDLASCTWLIVITCGPVMNSQEPGQPIGATIPCTAWNVWDRLAALQNALPAGWCADAYYTCL